MPADTPAAEIELERLLDRLGNAEFITQGARYDIASTIRKSLASLRAERDRLADENNRLKANAHLELYGMQDGSALRDLKAENERLAAQLVEARTSTP